jgi:membrane fusion protein
LNSPLFRPEVLAERQSQWLGTVLLAPTLSQRLFAIYALLVTGAIAALLFLGEYTRTAKVSGWLVPEQGVVRVFAAQIGVVTKLHVKEGGVVLRGEPLLALSTELQSATLGNTQAQIARGLNARRDSLKEELRQQKRLLVQQTRVFSNRLTALRSEEEQITEEIALQGSRLRLVEKSEARQRELLEKGFISKQQSQLTAEAKLEQASKLHALERNRTNLRRERLTLEGEMNDLPLKFQSEIATIERSVSTIGQELAEAEAKRETVVTAPQDGTVTAIQAEIGGHTNTIAPLLSILPVGTKLEAHLYTPSRSIGFVRPSQKVLIRYQAYPYQKFGHYEGTVSNISRSAMSPNELPAQLAGLTSLYGTNEPVYRITVSLLSQTATAYGEHVALQPGMQLEADVLIERRKLIEWILDPLYTLTGKWNG